ncbi:MAG: tetratricopeptide repeat protein [Sulfuricella sp.]
MTTSSQLVAQWIHSAHVANTGGKYESAAGLCKQALKVAPGIPEAWYNLGVALRGLGRLAEAKDAINKTRVLTLNSADAQNSIGLEFLELGAHSEAMQCFERAIVLAPDYSFPYSNMGKLQEKMKRYEDAEASFRKALRLQPDLAPVHANLCGILNAQKQHAAADAACRKALELDPNSPEAWSNLGGALVGLKRFEAAETAGRKALELDPNSPGAWNNLGGALVGLKRFEAAETASRKAIELDPNSSEAWNNWGRALAGLKRFEAAEMASRKAIEFDPNSPEAWSNLGSALSEQFRSEEAEMACQKAIELGPELAFPHSVMAKVYLEKGASQEAAMEFQQALAKDPHDLDTLSNLLFCLNYEPNTCPSEMIAIAQQFDQEVRAEVVPFDSWKCSSDCSRKLRIGLVSGDFRRHPVGYFLKGPLQEIDKSVFEMFAYSNYLKEDDLTAELRQHCAAWTKVVGKNHAELARQIHDDQIDILVDLSGHTECGRLPTFAWKPAPVQVTWLGYFATSGVKEIDWKIGDPWVTPCEEEHHFTEKIWRLPDSCFCFSPPDGAPAVAALPSQRNGYTTYGCFNNQTKVTDEVIEVWSRILRAAPEAKLFLKAHQMVSRELRETLLARFARHNIGPERLLLEGSGTYAEYLDAYARVDIALDPFPYAGGTTTAEGLWMGVPVVTLKGDRFIAHQGESILNAALLPDWIARDKDEYVHIALSRAADRTALAGTRAGLRSQVAESPLFDAPRFARNLEEAWRGMWQAWCKLQNQTERS